MHYTFDEIKKKAVPIAKSYGVDSISLFGSYARGDNDENSDLDFLIEKGEIKDLFAYGGMVSDLEKAFNVHIDLILKDSIKDDEFKKTIKKDEVVLYEK